MSRFRQIMLTAELVAKTLRKENDPGPNVGAVPLTDDEFLAEAERLDREAGDELWIFAYGSLIWKPVFTPAESRIAVAHGLHRSFCMPLTRWRGSPSQPGLMMALQRGGKCKGVAIRLKNEDRVEGLRKMLVREVDNRESLDFVRWIPCMIERHRVTALSFWVAPRGGYVAPKQSLEGVSEILTLACGHLGSGAEYLFNTVVHLDQLGIRDRNLWRLQELVAARLARQPLDLSFHGSSWMSTTGSRCALSATPG